MLEIPRQVFKQEFKNSQNSRIPTLFKNSPPEISAGGWNLLSISFKWVEDRQGPEGFRRHFMDGDLIGETQL